MQDFERDRYKRVIDQALTQLRHTRGYEKMPKEQQMAYNTGVLIGLITEMMHRDSHNIDIVRDKTKPK